MDKEWTGQTAIHIIRLVLQHLPSTTPATTRGTLTQAIPQRLETLLDDTTNHEVRRDVQSVEERHHLPIPVHQPSSCPHRRVGDGCRRLPTGAAKRGDGVGKADALTPRRSGRRGAGAAGTAVDGGGRGGRRVLIHRHVTRRKVLLLRLHGGLQVVEIRRVRREWTAASAASLALADLQDQGSVKLPEDIRDLNGRRRRRGELRTESDWSSQMQSSRPFLQLPQRFSFGSRRKRDRSGYISSRRSIRSERMGVCRGDGAAARGVGAAEQEGVDGEKGGRGRKTTREEERENRGIGTGPRYGVERGWRCRAHRVH